MSSLIPRDATMIRGLSDQSARISVCVDISVPRRSLLPMRGKNPGAYGVRVLPTQELPRKILFCKRLSRGQVPVSFDLPTKNWREIKCDSASELVRIAALRDWVCDWLDAEWTEKLKSCATYAGFDRRIKCLTDCARTRRATLLAHLLQNSNFRCCHKLRQTTSSRKFF